MMYPEVSMLTRIMLSSDKCRCNVQVSDGCSDECFGFLVVVDVWFWVLLILTIVWFESV